MTYQWAVRFTGSNAPDWGRRLAYSLLFLLLTACGSFSPSTQLLSELPPLQYQGESLELEQVKLRAPTPDLLALDEEMLDFVHRYTAGINSRRQRLHTLHRAVGGSATLGLEYDPFAGGTALEAFHSQSANCLSYANLFIALAREVGLDARYQWVDVRPSWTRMGERVAVRLHVNASVQVSARDRYMVDLDPLPAREITGSQEIRDEDAQALYHSNIAMDALSQEELDIAWVHAMRALQLSPQMSHLWVNLGVVYRRADQHQAAEAAYLHALEVDSFDRSAMNNLMVLYDLLGREVEYLYWKSRVDSYRDINPFYHAWLGDQAGEEHDWHKARGHYEEAVSLEPEDSELLFSLGIIHRELGQPKAALRYLGKAMSKATLFKEHEIYRAEYDRINRSLAAAQ
ncbi:tetratricopeptide repeat protein [Halieaceae bacterium IMCC8485]|uniref:Tetratricopeptide repeat protein n=1 Tax=Candidatus Seongchinamella marina TaxID=2518990 RepID=A0ABT3SZ87_9GAMM|nr:tetratricopeptide repeat protein [Candidatus Seongchinamella marina]MCX2975310.1 tetratricopeptide repeat protein [Candidatus Seongchinamella marina]